MPLGKGYSGDKVQKSSSMAPVRGGGGHMVGKTGADPKKPDMTAGTNTGLSGNWAKGGPSGQMVPFTGSKPAKAM